ncbi:MAG: M23 family metallopeptidase [Desulfobacteraceae bacterium]|nr:M23 family metallopeptidase [Desulfobacteraceae bacterium]
MSNKITLFVMSNSGTPVKNITISKAFIFFTILFVITCMGAAGYGVYDYLNIKKQLSENRELKDTVSFRMEQIVILRKQIRNFAGEINSLKSKILGLNNFEKQIRIIANLDDSDGNNDLFGVGGSIPEDLDANIDISEKHNSLIREMHNQVEQLDMATTTQEEGFESLIKELDGQKNLLASTPAIRPVRGVLTSKFGRRRSPFTGLKEFHKGLDIANRRGTPVVATADGTVTFAATKGFLGKLVTVNHGHGMVTNYGHLDKILKKSGEKVKRGDIIGTVGTSGRTTGPHVHYEVRISGMPVDPEKYILN